MSFYICHYTYAKIVTHMTPKVNLNVNDGFWVMMIGHFGSTLSNKCSTMVRDVDSGGYCDFLGYMRTL